MTVHERARLVCPTCGVSNRPGVPPVIDETPNGRFVVCGVCDTTGLESAFMPWLWTPPPADA